jgi:hypothetical protein
MADDRKGRLHDRTATRMPENGYSVRNAARRLASPSKGRAARRCGAFQAFAGMQL